MKPDIQIDKRFTGEPNPEASTLAAAVLRQALLDATHFRFRHGRRDGRAVKSQAYPTKEVAQEAMRWMREMDIGQMTFRFCCDALGLNPQMVIQKVETEADRMSTALLQDSYSKNRGKR